MSPQAHSYSVVPFQVEKSGHITIVAKLAGKEGRFVVDTGAGGTCLDSAALDGFALRLSKRSKTGGGVGSASMELTRVLKHDLSVAGIDLSGFTLHALDLSHVNAGLAAARVKPIVGVLGADVLQERLATIDYGRRHILLAEAPR